MAKPTNRTELIDYCLRALGAPVMEINIDDDQLEDRVDEALQFYQEYHSDAMVRTFIKHEITQEDIDTKEITLPDAVLSITRLIGINGSTANGMFSAKYQMHMNDALSLRGGGGLVSYEMTLQHLSLIDDVINGHGIQISYSRHKNTVKLHADISEYYSVGQFLIIECYQTIDPNSYPDVYNDAALKEYTTLLIKRQWGQNLSKFEGMQLPGGVTIQGRAIYEDAVADIKEMKETWDSKYGMPIDFFIG